MRTTKLTNVMLESMAKGLGITPAMLISWIKISFYQGFRVLKQLITWVFDKFVLCLYKLFFQGKTLQMRHSIVSVTGGVLCYELCPTGHVYRSEDFKFLPQVISCYLHLFSVVEDSISIELNIYLILVM